MEGPSINTVPTPLFLIHTCFLVKVTKKKEDKGLFFQMQHKYMWTMWENGFRMAFITQ